MGQDHTFNPLGYFVSNLPICYPVQCDSLAVDWLDLVFLDSYSSTACFHIGPNPCWRVEIALTSQSVGLYFFAK